MAMKRSLLHAPLHDMVRREPAAMLNRYCPLLSSPCDSTHSHLQDRAWDRAYTELIRVWFKFAATVEFCTSKSFEPGSEKDRFVLIDPDSISAIPTSTTSPYTAPLTVDTNIKPSKNLSRLYSSPPQADSTPLEHLIHHFHAGAFVLGGARTQMEAG
ncbi:hypothetical protein BJX64DRAFT_288033 [Aspergillus heterothallicus]